MKRHDKRNCPENPKNINKRSIESSEDTEDDDNHDMDEDPDSCDAYFVDLFVRASNIPAIKMYEKKLSLLLFSAWLFRGGRWTR
ncbi:hypothetical protein Dimus_033017 [Dionaea muscipula]